MELKNLRIGNWVNGNHNGFSKDVQIYNFIRNKIQHTDAKQNILPVDSFKPILLTEEWLLKFGFSDKDYKTGYIGIDIKFSNGITGDFTLTKPKHMGKWQNNFAFELREHRFVEIEYVHELQNLFFAINNTELELKNELSTCG